MIYTRGINEHCRWKEFLRKIQSLLCPWKTKRVFFLHRLMHPKWQKGVSNKDLLVPGGQRCHAKEEKQILYFYCGKRKRRIMLNTWCWMTIYEWIFSERMLLSAILQHSPKQIKKDVIYRLEWFYCQNKTTVIQTFRRSTLFWRQKNAISSCWHLFVDDFWASVVKCSN